MALAANLARNLRFPLGKLKYMSIPRNPLERNPLGTVGSIIVAVIFFYLLFKLLGFVFQLIWWAAPILFIASLVIDYKVTLGYLKMIGNLFQRNWLYGVLAGIASVVLFPLVAIYLLGMALFKKKVKERQQELDERVNGKWTDFEEVPVEPTELDIPYEELPPAPQPQSRQRDEGYDELFR